MSANDTSVVAAAAVCVAHTGDVCWLLISSILVLSMVPGLALFEVGLLRIKNNMSIFAQTFAGLTVMSIMWVLFGYSLTFGTDNAGIIGSLDKALFINVSFTGCTRIGTTDYEVPEALFAVFQMMFAAVTPLLMVGSVAERVRFMPFMVFLVLWELLVYYPIAHWIWGTGGWLFNLGAFDYAGGSVIHASTGFSSLVLALILGRRIGYDELGGHFPYSDLRMASAGASFLWIGWFGFNAGSGLRASPEAIQTVANTQVAACMSGAVWLIASWIEDKPSAVAMLNGAVAGLAAITPCSGFINTAAALGVSLVGGVVSFFANKLLGKLRIDDALGVSAAHGVTGVLGMIAIGLFASNEVNPGIPNGLAYGDGGVLLGWQTVATVSIVGYAMVVTLGLALIINKVAPLRASREEEVGGLDRFSHGERAMRMDHRLALSSNMSHSTNDSDNAVGERASKAAAASPRPRRSSSQPRVATTTAAVVGVAGAATDARPPAASHASPVALRRASVAVLSYEPASASAWGAVSTSPGTRAAAMHRRGSGAPLEH